MYFPEAPREMLPTDGLMKFYSCSDFPFNFNFIVDLTVLTLLDDLTGDHVHSVVSNWLDRTPEGKTPNWILGNHDYWRVNIF